MIALFTEPGFPTLGTKPLPLAALRKALATAGPVLSLGLDRLCDLDPQKMELLVLPYGSAFPKEGWADIFRYLEEGGNLLLLGGRPLEIPVKRMGKQWMAETAQAAYYQSLGIEQINTVSARLVVRHEAVPGEPVLKGISLPPLESHSLMVRFTEADEENRTGSTGPMDAELKPLLWGRDAQGRRVSCPAALIDRYQGRFAGGRWAIVAADLPRWNTELEKMVARLAQTAKVGAMQATLRPALACYEPGAQPSLNFWVRGHERLSRKIQVDYRITLEGETVYSGSSGAELKKASHYQTISLPIPVEPGFYRIQAEVSVNGQYSHTLNQGFWGWDENLVKSSATIGIKGTRFLRNGETLPIVGTTYMAGDVSRKFMTIPNPARWDEDMGEMASTGINMIRTGIWAAHRQVILDSGNTREDVLRAFDAFVLTCLKHGLALTFNFFSFIPDHWPSEHPYLDPRALSVQREYMLSLIRRYSRISSVLWDFINEPSVTNPQALWKTRPLPGKLEKKAFQEYLRKVHGDLDVLRVRWGMT
ncbi:MAG TPA: hypothetical protein VN963_07160, partial [bacterium]|nr:hypothetical protein [bacterium]